MKNQPCLALLLPKLKQKLQKSPWIGQGDCNLFNRIFKTKTHCFKLKKAVLILIFVSFCFFYQKANANSNPASTDFVLSVVNALRNELSPVFQSLQNQMSQLSQTVNGQLQSLQSQLNQIPQAMVNEVTRGIESLQNQLNELPIKTHQIGELWQGGIVFFVDETRQHGLITSVDDLHEGIEWRNGESGDRMVNAKGIGLGAGENNTRLIVAEQTVDNQEGQFAALIALNYQATAEGAPCELTANPTLLCYGGWFLPSIQELGLLYTNLKNKGLGALKEGLYWSSTEANFTQSFAMDFSQNNPQVIDKATPARVRAIRHF